MTVAHIPIASPVPVARRIWVVDGAIFLSSKSHRQVFKVLKNTETVMRQLCKSKQHTGFLLKKYM